MKRFYGIRRLYACRFEVEDLARLFGLTRRIQEALQLIKITDFVRHGKAAAKAGGALSQLRSNLNAWDSARGKVATRVLMYGSLRYISVYDFGYSLEELARRFDRSVSWVSRRLALVELLPEAIQQRVVLKDVGQQLQLLRSK